MRITTFVCLGTFLPAGLFGQQDPVIRLHAVLPTDVAERVNAIVQDATGQGLPSQAIVQRALEAQAKGSTGEQVTRAAQDLAKELVSARDLLKAAGRASDDAETEAGAAAHGMGVDGRAISALASSEPSGRSLAVPLAVLGSLVHRGLSSDEALAVVRARLVARATNADLAELPGEAGGLIAAGHRPGDVGRALGATRSGGSAASAATSSRGGPPVSVPSNNGSAGNRSRGHQSTQR